MTTTIVSRHPDFHQPYDLALVAAGYEQRSRFVAEREDIRSVRKACCAFRGTDSARFLEHLEVFSGLGYEIAAEDDVGFAAWVDKGLLQTQKDVINSGQPIRVLVDISSLSRVRIATVVDRCLNLNLDMPLEVDFAYALAAFSPPPEEASVISTAGPVLPRFAGWWTRPELPVSAVIGAGYEPDKALGVLEFLEPGLVWVWVPHGRDPRFLAAINESNSTLWEHLLPERRVPYDVLDPFETFVRLESLCYGLIGRSRPVIVPFGPKVFALIALLVAAHWPDDISVWRVSSEHAGEQVDCEADGKVVGIRVRFCRANSISASTDRAESLDRRLSSKVASQGAKNRVKRGS